MKYFKRIRWVSCSAVMAALFLFSSHASAVMITMENLTPTGGTLVLNFEGDPLGGLSDDLLEDFELTSFSAFYTAATDPMQITWGSPGTAPLIFSSNVISGIVESLFYDNFDLDLFVADPLAESYTVAVNSGPFGTANGHYAEISDSLFSVVAYTDDIPSPDADVPSPGTLLLLALGLLAMGGLSVHRSRARQVS